MLDLGAPSHYPEAANRPSAFTYNELEDIYGLIKPFRKNDQIARIREDLATEYDRVTYQRPLEIRGTINAFRSDGSLVFHVTKAMEPGQPSVYSGAVSGKDYEDRSEFESPNFSSALRILKSHIYGEYARGLSNSSGSPFNLFPQG